MRLWAQGKKRKFSAILTNVSLLAMTFSFMSARYAPICGGTIAQQLPSGTPNYGQALVAEQEEGILDL